MNFGEIFAKTLSSVQAEREDATRQLENAAKENLAAYLVCLCQELANEQQEVQLRVAAGIALKNTLTAREASRKEAQQTAWIALDPNAKAQIKAAILHTLASPLTRAGTAAAQVIAAVAAIELPRNEWPDLVAALLKNASTPGSSPALKQATLQAIGFICEETPPELLESQSDQILTAVMSGARVGEADTIRLAALHALLNSLDFAKSNFDRQNERDYIMSVVCEATKSENSEVVVAAYECLVRIMSLYYDKMALYMQQALFALTIMGMRSENDQIALQAIEFWATVCDEEMAIMEEMAEAEEYGEQPEVFCQHFARAALGEIVPVVLWLLTKQDEDADEDEWNPAMAAATCLSLLAQTVHNDIVPPVVPFVEQNIRNPNWRFREASVMAFGSILDGPESHILEGLVSQALPVIIEMMQDVSPHVKDTAAWTLGRISEYHPDCIKPEAYLQNLVKALIHGLADIPRVAANCGWAVTNLALNLNNPDEPMPSSCLSPYFEHLVTALLRAGERADATESNLRASVYDALAGLIASAPVDCVPVVNNTALIILDHLDAAIQANSQVLGTEEKMQLADHLTALCSVVQSVITRLGKEIVPLADRIMTAFLKLFHSGVKAAVIVEDIFLTVGALINVLEADFSRYMEPFSPFLFAALQNSEEHQLCQTATGIVGDVCRALGPLAVPYCNQLMTLLLQNLQSEVVHRDVKPHILSTFGDVALAIQAQFEPYLNVVMMVLQQACSMPIDPNNFDMVDYGNALREGILQAYTGIVQGLKADNQAALLMPYVEGMFSFLKVLSMDKERSDAVTRGAIGVIGDVADALRGPVKQLLGHDWVENFLKAGRSGRSSSASTKEVAKWAKGMVKTAMASA